MGGASLILILAVSRFKMIPSLYLFLPINLP